LRASHPHSHAGSRDGAWERYKEKGTTVNPIPEPFRPKPVQVRDINEILEEQLTSGQRAADWAWCRAHGRPKISHHGFTAANEAWDRSLTPAPTCAIMACGIAQPTGRLCWAEQGSRPRPGEFTQAVAAPASASFGAGQRPWLDWHIRNPTEPAKKMKHGTGEGALAQIRIAGLAARAMRMG
jgi:hypothetical protein